MSAIIEVASVTVQVKTATLIENLSLTIETGETVAIVGPNGAGKSTLMRVLSGDLSPSAGTVRLKNREVRDYAADDLAANRAVLSQHIQVTFPFTVDEIVRMGGSQHPAATVQQMVGPTLAECDLGAFARREIPTLSGGEQQRAHFARVLVQSACGELQSGPGVLLLDEPTSSLDLKHQLNLLESARRRADHGTAVIAVLHDLNLAARFARRIIVLHRGRLVADGTPSGTITNAIMHDVFGIDAEIGTTRDDVPYVLPQSMTISGTGAGAAR